MNGTLTVNEAAKRKGTTRQAIYAAIESGALRSTKAQVEVIGIKETDLAKWTPNPRSVKNAGRPRSDKSNQLRKGKG